MAGDPITAPATLAAPMVPDPMAALQAATHQTTNQREAIAA
jgi:hypothetical protein